MLLGKLESNYQHVVVIAWGTFEGENLGKISPFCGYM